MPEEFSWLKPHRHVQQLHSVNVSTATEKKEAAPVMIPMDEPDRRVIRLQLIFTHILKLLENKQKPAGLLAAVQSGLKQRNSNSAASL